jgi:hypothetical protein
VGTNGTAHYTGNLSAANLTTAPGNGTIVVYRTFNSEGIGLTSDNSLWLGEGSFTPASLLGSGLGDNLTKAVSLRYFGQAVRKYRPEQGLFLRQLHL